LNWPKLLEKCFNFLSFVVCSEKRKCDEQETVVEGLKTVYKKLKRKLTKQDKEAIQEVTQYNQSLICTASVSLFFSIATATNNRRNRHKNI